MLWRRCCAPELMPTRSSPLSFLLALRSSPPAPRVPQRSRMIALGERFEAGVTRVISKHGLPWIVKRLGCRVEYWFAPAAPKNGAEAAAAADADLDRFMHLAALNRGILMTVWPRRACTVDFVELRVSVLLHGLRDAG